MKRVFGNLEIAFDIMYLVSAFIIGIVLLMTSSSDLHTLAGIMTIILVVGDSFHLIPRIKVIITKNEKALRTALGRGKQITSVSMTIFYLLLWQIGLQISSISVLPFWNYLIYAMAVLRVVLCFLPANRWVDVKPPVKWGIYRNIPFFYNRNYGINTFFPEPECDNKYPLYVAGNFIQLFFLSSGCSFYKP